MTRELMAEIVERAASAQSQRQIARETGTPRGTIQRALAVMEPVVDQLRGFQRDAFMTGWQAVYLDTLQEFYEKAEAKTLTPSQRKDLAITLGISTEKTLLLSGQPTQLVGHLHEVRISLPQLAARLADVSRAVGQPSALHEPRD